MEFNLYVYYYVEPKSTAWLLTGLVLHGNNFNPNEKQLVFEK